MFDPLNQFFDHIYVLSVEAARDRRDRFDRLFQGMNYQYFFGADKNKFNQETISREGIYSEEKTRARHRYGKSMRPGEIACAWSHRMIYEHMLKNNYRQVLIFEDDAVPDSRALKALNEVLSELPHNWELVFLGYGKNARPPLLAPIKKTIYHLQHMMGLLKWDHQVIRNLYARPFSKHLRRAGFHDFTFAYAITSGAAEKLLRMQQPIQYLADNLLAHAATGGVLQSFISHPPLFLHDTLPDGSPRDSYIR